MGRKETKIEPMTVKRIIELRDGGTSQLNIAKQVSKEFNTQISQGLVSKVLINAGLRTLKKKKRTSKKTRRDHPVLVKPRKSFGEWETIVTNEHLTTDEKLSVLNLLARGKMLS